MTILEPQTNDNKQKTVTLSVYNPKNKNQWDNFVSSSKNGVFLFNRDYMEYHSDRFIDHSLMFYNNEQLVAVMPANEKDDALYSHGGLTFGGVVSGYDMTARIMLEIFEKIKQHCISEGFSKIIYKTIPHIYHSVPAEEDLYALFRFGAKLTGRNVSSSILLSEKRPFQIKRREAITKARKNKLVVRQNYDFDGFMKMVGEVVSERHGANPVHSPEEMVLLASRFPQNIKLFSSFLDNAVLAGCLIYESKNVVHGQYAANSKLGRTLCAQDIIIEHLVNEYCAGKNKKYFDFGTSNLELGQVLNEGLIAHKESFRASSIVYDFYELPI
jgi:hypothetical protein